jgi:dihydrofolate reductase
MVCHNHIMQHARISIIAALGENRELGRENNLIWRISPDLKRVKALTMGHPIIMGRKTFDSIGHPLPGRTNIVITRVPTPIEGCLVFDSLEKALETGLALDHEEIFIFGGASIYEAALPRTDRLYLTLIHETAPDADVHFPPYASFTNEISREDHLDHSPSFSWVTLDRSEPKCV